MSNLAVHYIPTHNRPNDLALIQAVSNRLCKLVTSGRPDRSMVAEIYNNRLAKDGVLILRNHSLSEQKDDVVRDPVGTGRRHAEDWQDWLRTANIHLDPRRTRFEGINEFPMWVHGNEPLNAYYAAFADRLEELGWFGCLGQINVGWPANSGDDTPSNWQPYHDMLSKLSWQGHWLGLHEYFGLTGPRERLTGWWAYRYRHCIDYCADNGLPFPPIVITELGICQDFQNEKGDWGLDPQAGYKGAMDPGAAFSYLMQYAQDSQADGIIGCTVFTTDGGHPWIESMDTEPMHPYWLRAGSQSLGKPPAQRRRAVQQPKPTPRPQVPDVSQRSDAGPVNRDASLLRYPPVSGVVTQGFGLNPEVYKRFGMPGHDGIDFGAPHGESVYALADGEVAWVDIDPDYGKYIRIWHPHLRVHSFYAHLSDQLVARGDKVKTGNVIGRIGNTGNSTGPHLHFEIRLANEDGSYLENRSSGYGHGRIDPSTWYEVMRRA